MDNYEIEALLHPQISALARTLYLILRLAANKQDATVSISLKNLVSKLTFLPPPKSTTSITTPTKKQVRVLIQILIGFDLVRQSKKGDKRTLPIWFLPYMFAELKQAEINHRGHKQGHNTKQYPQGFEAYQGHNEGHKTAGHPEYPESRGAQQNPVTTQDSALCGACQGHKNTSDEGHNTSQYSQGFDEYEGRNYQPDEGHIVSNIYINKDLNNKYKKILKKDSQIQESKTPSNDTQIFIHSDDLTMTTEFNQIARLVGLNKSPEQLNDIFIDFANHKTNMFKHESKAYWLRAWKGWCARNKQFTQPTTATRNNRHEKQIHTTNTHGRNHQEYDQGNPTASVLNWCLTKKSESDLGDYVEGDAIDV